ncbi:MAG: histidine phosphatase family protein [Thermodesulfovibrio sp.]|nr:histidine phosphatase family protein [Thermodesulfovibrio sp.]
MLSTIYLIRHGRTEGDDTKRYKGSIDLPLSAAGVSQIQQTASLLARYVAAASEAYANSYLRDIHGTAGNVKAETASVSGLEAVYCSDLRRAFMSAKIIADSCGLIPVTVPELRERSFGLWEGMSFSEIREQYPREFENWAENPLLYSPPGGETTTSVEKRTLAAWKIIAAAHPAGQIAVVAHGGVNRVILSHILGAPLENIFRIEQGYGCINIIEQWQRYPVVKLMNGTCSSQDNTQ